MVPAILAELAAAGVPRERITLFNATGTHRPNTPRGARPACWARRSPPATGSCRTTRAPRDAHVARRDDRERERDPHPAASSLACSFTILTGFIEPHFFAGFSGGGKAIMPGLAHLDTVMRNHGAREHRRPAGATWGVTRRQPRCARRSTRRSRSSRPDFLVNVALNRDKADHPRASPATSSRPTGAGTAFVQEDRHGAGGRAVRHRRHHELRLAPRPEPLPGGQGNERGRADRPAGRLHRRRRGVPRRRARPRLVRPAAARGADLDDLLARIRVARLPDGRPMAGADPRPHREEGRRLRARRRPDGRSRSPLAMLRPCPSVDDQVAELLEKYGPRRARLRSPRGPADRAVLLAAARRTT